MLPKSLVQPSNEYLGTGGVDFFASTYSRGIAQLLVIYPANDHDQLPDRQNIVCRVDRVQEC